MSVLDVVTAIVGLVEDCLGDSCDYLVTAGQGAAPLEGCNQISIFPLNSMVALNTACYDFYDERIVVSVTRCCPTIDGDLVWQQAQEEKEAVCHLTTINDIENCLQCNLIDALTGITVCPKENAMLERVEYAPMREGGCYTINMVIKYQRKHCCPVV